MRKTPIALLVVAILGLAPVAHADVKIVDFQGHAWEDGGFLPSNIGDVLHFVGVTVEVDAIFGIDLNTEELTVYVTDLVSTGQVDIGGGWYAVSYSGGILELWNDTPGNFAYGINPPNATAPSTFVDGALLLRGTFNNFSLYYGPTATPGAFTGSYSSDITWTAGSALADVQGIENDGFTFGGVLNPVAASGSVPEGYDLQVDGKVEITVITAVEETTWGGVKNLFR